VIRPANTSCRTCPFWDSSENTITGQTVGLCCAEPPTETKTYTRWQLRGQGVLDAFLRDGNVADEVSSVVEKWVAERDARLPREQASVTLAIWPPTLANYWCGRHPNMAALARGESVPPF